MKPLSDWTHTRVVVMCVTQYATLSWQRNTNYAIDSTSNSVWKRRTRFVLQYRDTSAIQASSLWRSLCFSPLLADLTNLPERSCFYCETLLYLEIAAYWLMCFFPPSLSLLTCSSGPRLSGSLEAPHGSLCWGGEFEKRKLGAVGSEPMTCRRREAA